MPDIGWSITFLFAGFFIGCACLDNYYGHIAEDGGVTFFISAGKRKYYRFVETLKRVDGE